MDAREPDLERLLLDPAAIEAATLRWLRPRARNRPDLRLIEWCGERVVVKDWRAASLLLRPHARRCLAREWRALAVLAGLPGVPRALLRLRDVIVVSYLDGEPLAYRRLQHDQREAFFAALLAKVEQMHARGVVHLDLRQRRNIVCGADGQPGLLDFEAALVLDATRVSGRLALYWGRKVDRLAILKHKARCAAAAPQGAPAGARCARGAGPGLRPCCIEYGWRCRRAARRLIEPAPARGPSGSSRRSSQDFFANALGRAIRLLGNREVVIRLLDCVQRRRGADAGERAAQDVEIAAPVARALKKSIGETMRKGLGLNLLWLAGGAGSRAAPARRRGHARPRRPRRPGRRPHAAERGMRRGRVGSRAMARAARRCGAAGNGSGRVFCLGKGKLKRSVR
jgi:predicted Ser/Thr protein kinase